MWRRQCWGAEWRWRMTMWRRQCWGAEWRGKVYFHVFGGFLELVRDFWGLFTMGPQMVCVNFWYLNTPPIFKISTFSIQCCYNEGALVVCLQFPTFSLLTPHILSPHFVSYFIFVGAWTQFLLYFFCEVLMFTSASRKTSLILTADSVTCSTVTVSSTLCLI